MVNIKSSLFILVLIFISESLISQEVQWRGPNRDGKYPATNLLKEWPEGGPELLLQKDGFGGGYSTPALYDGVIYVTGRRDTLEVITAADMDGNVLWETIYGKAWMESFQETRNSPAIENGRIYITGAMGTVNCIDAKTGHKLWSRNTHEQFKAGFHRWGMAESVLLTEEAVISSPSGEETVMVALDKEDGSLIWESPKADGVRSYVSPLMIEYNGVKMILATTSKELVGINPENGEILWRFDVVQDLTSRGRRINANTPLYKDGEIFFSSGYDDTALMLKLADDCRSVSIKWKSDVLDVHHGGMVLVDGYIYGSNWINNGNGNWVCLDWNTGEVMWDEEWHNKGAIIYADGMLYIFDEKKGNLGLMVPSPDRFDLKGSFTVDAGRGPRWAHPAIFDNKLFIRHHDVLLIYNLSAD